MHFFVPQRQGQFRQSGRVLELVAWDICTCGAHRWSEVLLMDAVTYAEAATS